MHCSPGHTGSRETLAYPGGGITTMQQFYLEPQTIAQRVFNPTKLYTYRGHSTTIDTPIIAVAWSPDGTRIASAGSDHTVQVWDAATGITILTYCGHSDDVFAISW